MTRTILFWEAIKLLLVTFGVLDAGLVLMSCRTDGPRSRLRVNPRDPARSAERLLVWVGVKALAALLRVGHAAFDALSEASAEVGEWFIRRRRPEVQALFRSRFL